MGVETITSEYLWIIQGSSYSYGWLQCIVSMLTLNVKTEKKVRYKECVDRVDRIKNLKICFCESDLLDEGLIVAGYDNASAKVLRA